jgi:endoglucanase
LIEFLEETDADFGYWAINPRKPDKNEIETYSLFEDDWISLIYDYRTHDMARLSGQRLPKKSYHEIMNI